MQWMRSSNPAQLPVSDPTGQQTGQIEPGNDPIDLPVSDPTDNPTDDPAQTLPEDGSYTSKEDVALYLHTYGHLPGNFITKREAEKLGWPGGGSLEPYAPGKCIGGDRFGNYQKKLPVKDGRRYQECDIDTLGAKSRGARRIVFSNDGLIYYTEDHYEHFTLLYGKEGG
ncbi:MAG: ribonuclease [Oscillospiraceae bacterium]|nr:ribonuclease [Oscillospiraceae bacterium]